MIMQMFKETYDKMNYLLGKSFDCNAQTDNFAYNIDYARYPVTADIFHHSFAHEFPVFADTVSDLMIRLDSRPIRKQINGYDKDYEGDLAAIFADNLLMCETYRQDIIDTIEVAEFNGDYEVKIKLEEFLLGFVPYRKQADIWAEMAKRYEGNYKSFEARMETFTTFIEIKK